MHVYRLVWRQMILFAHNIVIFVIIAIIFPKPWSWADLTVLPALALIMLNCVWVSFCFGILATRYRDIGPLLSSLVQLLFFMTPIIWNADTLEQQGAGKYWRIIELNPLLHYLDILRAPCWAPTRNRGTGSSCSCSPCWAGALPHWRYASSGPGALLGVTPTDSDTDRLNSAAAPRLRI